MNKKLLVLGGRGYLGSALCDYLHNKGDQICSIDCEWFGNPLPSRQGRIVSPVLVPLAGTSRNPSEYRTIRRKDYKDLHTFEIEWADAIILVAAHSSVSMCQRDPYGAFQNNVVNFVNLLQRVREGQKFIYASSSCVYDRIENAKEICDVLVEPTDYLTLTKQTIDRVAKLSNVEYYGLRLGSVAGWSPNLRSDLMVNAMVLDALYKGEVRITNAEKYRPILAIQDFCRAVEMIVDSKEDRRGIYNVASVNARIEDVGIGVGVKTGVLMRIGTGESSYNFTIDCSRFRETFGFTFEYDLPKIINDLVADIREVKAPTEKYAKGRDVDIRYGENK